MEQKFRHLTLADRQQIAKLVREGLLQSQIAEKIGRTRKTICHEFKRAGVDHRGYYPDGSPYDALDAYRKARN